MKNLTSERYSMNRRELFSQAFTMLRHNPALWSIALIGLAINVVFSLLLFNPALVIVGMFMAFVAAAFAEGALISMVNAIADNEGAGLIDGLRAGLARLIPLLAVSVVLMIPVWLVLVFMTGSVDPIFTSGLGRPDTLQPTNMVNVAGSVFSLVGVIIALQLAASAIGVGAERAIVLEDTPIVSALQRGWTLLRMKYATFISIALVFLGMGLAISLLFGWVIVPLLVTLLSPEIAAAQAQGRAIDLAAYFFSPANVVFLMVNLIAGSLITAFISSVWTLAFRHWQSE